MIIIDQLAAIRRLIETTSDEMVTVGLDTEAEQLNEMREDLLEMIQQLKRKQ